MAKAGSTAIISSIIITVILIIAANYFGVGPTVSQIKAWVNKLKGAVTEVKPTDPAPAKPAPAAEKAELNSEAVELDLITQQMVELESIRIFEPLSNLVVQSPLTVKGQAKGSWFFEASFPIKITDAEGRVLGASFVTAKDNWMTNDFVDFAGTVRFEPGRALKGYLILEKDNPSGLPENAMAVRVPVAF